MDWMCCIDSLPVVAVELLLVISFEKYGDLI